MSGCVKQCQYKIMFIPTTALHKMGLIWDPKTSNPKMRDPKTSDTKNIRWIFVFVFCFKFYRDKYK